MNNFLNTELDIHFSNELNSDLYSDCCDENLENDFNLINQSNKRNKRKQNFDDILPDNFEVSVSHAPLQVIEQSNFNIYSQPTLFLALQDFDENLVEYFSVGKLSVECSFCKALYFEKDNPTFDKCCKKGKINLPFLKDPPDYLKNLYDHKSEFSKVFYENIRALNNLFSFTSIGEKGLNKNLANRKKGVYCYRINDTIHHFMGSLLPLKDGERKFSQFYIFDNTNENVKKRSDIFKHIDRHLIEGIQTCLESSNNLIKKYKQIGKKVLKSPNYKMIIRDDFEKIDIRVYNQAAPNQIAAVIPSSTDMTFERDIIIQQKDDKLQRISHYHSLCDALSYILFFPYGETGYNNKLYYLDDKNEYRRITLAVYVRYYLQLRKNNFNTIFKGSSLFLQFLVNKYCDIESEKLNWIRSHQKDIKVDSYKGMIDAFNNHETLNDIGKLVILPASFYGSFRFLVQLYKDAMATVLQCGKPDLFITFTCNPLWPEITENLFDNQKSWQRPDLVNLVFKIKLRQLIDDIKKKQIFGKVLSYIYVVENQKRGLPHAHIIVILHKDNKIDTVDKINSCVCAEVPDRNKNPILYEKVCKYMFHRPCGLEKQECIRNEKCSKRFPKAYSDETIINDFSYPTYRRRNQFKFKYKNYIIGDEYIVPYNKYLLLKYDAHINTEICSYFSAVKYLYKYVYKGPDKAIAEFNFDEIKHYLDSRFVTSHDSYWKIFEIVIYKNYPNVIRLPIHLEDQQQVYFKNNDNINDKLSSNTATTLTAWFESNKKYPQYRNVLYKDYPIYFWFNKNKKIWVKRSANKNVVSRMYDVNIQEGDRFYLKILLNYKSGAKSFADLKEFNGRKFNTFYEVVEEMGLLDNNNLWIQTIEESIIVLKTKLCRQLFAYLFIYSGLLNFQELWEKYKTNLSDDLLKKYDDTLDDDEIYNLSLAEINDVLIENGKCLEDFGIKLNNNKYLDLLIKKSLNKEELNQFTTELNMLTSEQKDIYDLIINSVNNNYEKTNNIYFIDAFGGSGKTFLLNVLIKKSIIENYNPISVASSGIAALLLKNGKTAHYTFKIPLDVDEFTTCNFKQQDLTAKLIKECKIIIWDEISMSHKNVVETVERSVRSLIGNQFFFGGKIVLFSGDFRQILPIVEFGKSFESISFTIKSSYIWNNITIKKLTKNLRIKDQSEDSLIFSQFLLDVGNGNIEKNEDNTIVVPDELYSKSNSIEDFVDEFFDYNDNFENEIILAIKNEDCNEINQIILDKHYKLQEQYTFYSCDSVEDNQNGLFPVEYLNILEPTGFPPHKLVLKLGCIVILLRNMYPKLGFCNGSRCKVVKVSSFSIEIELISGSYKGNKTSIPKIILNSRLNRKSLFVMKRIQFPIKLAFCITVNKSQGQSLDKVGIFLKNQPFSHGQLYVALSRCKNHKNIIIYSDSKNIKNIVYKEILV